MKSKTHQTRKQLLKWCNQVGPHSAYADPAEIIKSPTKSPIDARCADTTSRIVIRGTGTEAEPVPTQVAPTQIPQTETSPVETDVPSQLANEKSSPANTVFSSPQDIAMSLNEAGENSAARLRQHLRPVSLEDGKLKCNRLDKTGKFFG